MIRLPRYTRTWLTPRIEDGRVLEKDLSGRNGFHLKVLLGQDGMIYKFFRVRQMLSSNLYSPYAWRFSRNADRLRKDGIRAPEVQDMGYLPEVKRQFVTYPLIEGHPLREYLETAEPEPASQVLNQLGRFIADLHDRGIYFHAGHLNNYIQCPDQRFALIDVTDVHFRSRPLSRMPRIRNLAKLEKGKANRDVLQHHGWTDLVDGYNAAAQAQSPVTAKDLASVGGA